MTIRTLTLVALVAAVAGFWAGTGFAEDAQPSDEEMMKMMLELGQPGAPHAEFKDYAGSWTGTQIHHKPGEEDQSTTSSAEAEVTMNGRFLRTRIQGDMGGHDFRGVSILGYDNFKKEYQSFWLDSLSSGMMMSTGQRSDDGTISVSGTWDGPMGKMPMRHTYRMPDKDTMVVEGYMSMGDQEMKHMTITYKRKK